MRLRNRLQNFVMDSGERSVLLVQRDAGLPLFHPNLFATTQVRNRSLSLASMDAQLTAINVLLTHCAEQKIDLVPRFLQGKFLKTHELDALRDFCQHAFERRRLSRGTAVVDMMTRRPGRRTAKVSRQCQYSRLSTIASYLKWLAHELLTHRVDEQSSLRIERMFSGIQSRRPSTSSRGEMARNKALSKDQILMLFHVIAPDSSENPFVDPAVRWRNCLMIYLLNYLGIRAGELLNIRIDDIDWSHNQIVIARRPDEPGDPRTKQPLVKTLDRRLELRETLSRALHDYIIRWRNKVPGARRHKYLFVTHKSGPTQGGPLSLSSYAKVMRCIANAHPSLEGFHGHLLRHTWNERFSELMDRMVDPPSKEQQEKVRSYAQGWAEGSGSAATYNRRFVEREARKVQLQLQEGMMPRRVKVDEE